VYLGGGFLGANSTKRISSCHKSLKMHKIHQNHKKPLNLLRLWWWWWIRQFPRRRNTAQGCLDTKPCHMSEIWFCYVIELTTHYGQWMTHPHSFTSLLRPPKFFLTNGRICNMLSLGIRSPLGPENLNIPAMCQLLTGMCWLAWACHWSLSTYFVLLTVLILFQMGLWHSPRLMKRTLLKQKLEWWKNLY